MGITSELIKKSREYVIDFMQEHFSDEMCYHNIDHTQEVVQAAEVIGTASALSEKDLELVIVAAWFHDTGYYRGCTDHEAASADIARKFLTELGTPASDIEKATSCIMATQIPQSPGNLMEEVLCDADLYHLATTQFFEKTELLRLEMCSTEKDAHIASLWTRKSCEFIAGHRYHTEYGRKYLKPKKMQNLEKLKSHRALR
jgi:predicted metal-dependent HD superfamily phosphohydrolase